MYACLRCNGKTRVYATRGHERYRRCKRCRFEFKTREQAYLRIVPYTEPPPSKADQSKVR